MHRFLGKLIGTAVRHGLQMGLDLSPLVWRPLAGLPLSSKHLELIDATTSTLLNRIRSVGVDPALSDDHSWLSDLRFVTYLSDGTEEILCPNGSEVSVTMENRHDYVRLVEQKRLIESRSQLRALSEGASEWITRFSLCRTVFCFAHGNSPSFHSS